MKVADPKTFRELFPETDAAVARAYTTQARIAELTARVSVLEDA